MATLPINPDELLKATFQALSPIENQPWHEVFRKLLTLEGGIDRLLINYELQRDALREEVENAYLRDNRDGAVKAGMLRGLRLAFEVLPALMLRSILVELAEAKAQAASPPDDDDGY